MMSFLKVKSTSKGYFPVKQAKQTLSLRSSTAFKSPSKLRKYKVSMSKNFLISSTECLDAMSSEGFGKSIPKKQGYLIGGQEIKKCIFFCSCKFYTLNSIFTCSSSN